MTILMRDNERHESTEFDDAVLQYSSDCIAIVTLLWIASIFTRQLGCISIVPTSSNECIVGWESRSSLMLILLARSRWSECHWDASSMRCPHTSQPVDRSRAYQRRRCHDRSDAWYRWPYHRGYTSSSPPAQSHCNSPRSPCSDRSSASAATPQQQSWRCARWPDSRRCEAVSQRIGVW